MFNIKEFGVGHIKGWDDELMIHKGVKQWDSNILYIVGQYEYLTDGIKNVVDARGFLSRGTADRHLSQQRSIGKSYRPTGDDGGHIFASSFGGSGSAINMIPQNSDYNRKGPWRQLEIKWMNLLKSGHQVYAIIKPVYPDNCIRPWRFNIWSVVDYTIHEDIIYNPL